MNMSKKKINWEERRFYAATKILGGMCANYHHTFIPATHWVTSAVRLADVLMKALSNPDKGNICPELYDPKVSE